MKPCSPSSSPTQQQSTTNTRLSVRMKPQPKIKSPDLLKVRSCHVPLLKQLTSTQTKPGSPLSTNTSRLTSGTKCPSKSKTSRKLGDVSEISPIKEANWETGKKTVPRSKVKSPINSVRGIVGKSGSIKKEMVVTKDMIYVGDEINSKKKSRSSRNRLEELELQVKKKDCEIVNLNRKLNGVQKSLTEKEKEIKGLEVKIPKMLADLKKSLLEDDSKKKANRDLKESLKRNRNLSGSMKHVEEQLKLKEAKLKEALENKKKVDFKLKTIEKECRESSQQISFLECRLIELQKKVSSAEIEVTKEKLRRNELEERFHNQCDENSVKDKIITKLKTDVFHLGNVAASRENEMKIMQQQNFELQNVIKKQDVELVRILKDNSQCRTCNPVITKDQGVIPVASSLQRLDSTYDILDKSDSSRQDLMDMKKVTVRNSQRSNCILEDVPTLEYTSTSFTSSLTTSSLHSHLTDEFVPESSEYKDTDVCMEDVDMMEDSTPGSELSIPSSGTCRRLEELDVKVQGLWGKLSGKEFQGDSLFHGQAQFHESVLRMERDLDQSVMQHTELVAKVGVAKRLFE